MDTPFQPTQIAFVLDNVADYQSLVAGIPEGTAVYVLDSHNKDVLAQMEAITANYSDLSAIHLLSHGSSGALDLGSMSLNDDNVNDYADTLAQIGSHLSQNGDILLYGCNVAEGTAGAEFIGRLTQVTGADIAASTDLTGSAALGGDWVLESNIGTVETNVISRAVFDGTLSNVNTQELAVIDGTWPTGGVNADPGMSSFATFTYTFTATLANTLISFMINNDPSYTTLDNIVVYDNADGSHTNMITNGSFSGNATPVGSVNVPDHWMAIGQQGLSAAGTLSGGTWYDGAVGGYDGIAQGIATTVGHTYTVTFDMMSDDGGMGYSYNASENVVVKVYAGPLPDGVSVTGSLNNAPTVSTGSNSLSGIATSSDSAPQKVADILGLSGTSYADSDGTTTKGIAITSTTTVGSGSWQYSADGSTGWTNFSASSASSAMLLDQNYYVRFHASSTGGTASFTYAGWDETDGNASGSAVNATTRGNTTAYSTNTHTVNLAVSSGPASPATPVLSTGSDTGSSNSDGITSATSQTINGSGVTAGATVTVYDGVTQLGTATADGSGNWSYNSSLASGSHSITATQTTGGQTSSASGALSITIDTTAPAAPSAPDMSAGTDSGTSNTDNITNDTTPTFTGTAEANSTITLYDTDGTTVLGTATANGSGNWNITSSALSAGSHTLTAKATDTAGNTSVASSSLSVVINTAVPTDIALSNNTASTSGGANAVVGSLSSTDVTVGDTFTYSLVAGTGDTNNASFNISGSNLRVNDPSALGAGTYSILVRSTDVAGNTYDEVQSITISSNPTVTISADDTSLKSGQTATVTFTFSETPTGFDATDITVSGGTLSGLAVTGNPLVYTATLTPTPNTASLSGSVSIAAAAFTGSGNDSLASNTLSITGDTLVPTAPTITSLASSSDSTPTVTGTTEANATVTVVIAGATYATTANGSGVWSVDTGSATPDNGTLAVNSNGNNSVSVTATDSAGNISSAAIQTLVIDTTVPTFTSAATSTDGTKVILTYSEALNASTAGTSDFTVQVGGQTVTVSSVAVSGSTVELALASAISNGQTVTVAYTDPTGGDDTNAVQDSALNDAATLASTSVTNNVPAPAPSGGGGGTTPPTTDIISDTGIHTTPTTTTTVGTTTVTTQTGTGTRTYVDDSGHAVTQNNITVEAVQITAPISGSAETTAEVPLYWGESTRNEAATTASVSSGVILSSEGNRAPTTTQTHQSAIDDLIYYIQTTVPSTDSTKSEMLSGGSSFLSQMANINTLVVNKVTLSATSTGTAPATVSLDGTANSVTTNGVTDTPKEALVIDATSLQGGSTLTLSNIEFGVLTGSNLNVVLNGTASQTVFAGSGTQTFTTLASNQNQLFAGAGNDQFHISVPSISSLSAPRAEALNSLSTSDTFADSIVNKTALYGEDGNDTTTVDGSGTQNVFVHGGSGEDSISYQGSINDYTITRDNGITYIHSNATSKTDVLLNVESIQFDDGIYTIAYNNDLTQIASLYQQVLGRQAEVDGFQYWASTFDNGDTIGAIATSFVCSSEYFNNTSNVWDAMSNDQRIETFYELMLGRASDAAGKGYWMDAINNGTMSIQDIAGCFVVSAEMQGICPAAQEWNFTA